MVLVVIFWVLLQVRIHLVLAEDGLMGSIHEVLWLLWVPGDKADGVFRGAGQAMVETVVCDDDKMCSSQDSVHVFIVLTRKKGRLDEFQKLVMVCLPKFGGAHGLVEVYVHVFVVWVVASMTTGSLIKVCRRVSYPYCCILFLRYV